MKAIFFITIAIVCSACSSSSSSHATSDSFCCQLANGGASLPADACSTDQTPGTWIPSCTGGCVAGVIGCRCSYINGNGSITSGDVIACQ